MGAVKCKLPLPPSFDVVVNSNNQAYRLIDDSVKAKNMQGIAMLCLTVKRSSERGKKFLKVVANKRNWDVLNHSTAGDVVKICSSLANNDIECPKFLESLDTPQFAKRLLFTGTSGDCALIAWSLAKLDHDTAKSPIFDAIESDIENVFSRGNRLDISQLCYAWGKGAREGRERSEESKINVFKCVNSCRDKFVTGGTGGYRELSMAIHAMALGGRATTDRNFFDFVSRELGAKVARSGDVRALSNICYSFARGGVDGENLFMECVKEGKRIARDGNVQVRC